MYGRRGGNHRLKAREKGYFHFYRIKHPKGKKIYVGQTLKGDKEDKLRWHRKDYLDFRDGTKKYCTVCRYVFDEAGKIAEGEGNEWLVGVNEVNITYLDNKLMTQKEADDYEVQLINLPVEEMGLHMVNIKGNLRDKEEIKRKNSL